MAERLQNTEHLGLSVQTTSTRQSIGDQLEGLTSFEIDATGNTILRKTVRRTDGFRSSYWRSRIEKVAQ